MTPMISLTSRGGVKIDRYSIAGVVIHSILVTCETGAAIRFRAY